MVTKTEVIGYLESLTSTELEEVFKLFVEYKENYILEDKICCLEAVNTELEEQIECLKYKDSFYE